jgi:hypothetical protein
MTGPELERETFDHEGHEIVWPRVQPRKPPRLEGWDDHSPPLDDPEDARWLPRDDPRRRELEGER